jgi:septum site-determining protein MinC
MKRIQSSPPQRSVVTRRIAPARRPRADVRKAEVAALFAELWEQSLKSDGLRRLDGLRRAEALATKVERKDAPEDLLDVAPAGDAAPCLFIDRPVRSGQSIRFPEGSVTIFGSVSSGAEIVAGGSIHVYGALRGRAFAGFGGNSGARIICSSLDPELLVINGLYTTADEIAASLRNKPAQVRVDGQAMSVTALD